MKLFSGSLMGQKQKKCVKYGHNLSRTFKTLLHALHVQFKL